MWLRILQFPLIRLFLLGPLLFLLSGISNGLWEVTFADRPLIGIVMAALMAAIGLGIYVASPAFRDLRFIAADDHSTA